MDLKKTLGYFLSLPERTLRSASAAVGGVSKLLTDSLFPRSMRNLTIYKAIIGNTQKFIIQSLGEVETGEQKLPDDYVARKIVGNVVDAAGIFAFRFSPLWFFAIVGDAAGGAKEFLGRVVGELEKDGAIPPGRTIESIDQLLEALQEASAKSTGPLDAPPLSKADLATLKKELAESYGELFRTSKEALPSLDSIWGAVQEIRAREKLPLLRLSGAMALAATKAVGKASGSLFCEKVLASYQASIAEVRSAGFANFFAEAARPYLDAVASAFSLSKRTLTQELLGL